MMEQAISCNIGIRFDGFKFLRFSFFDGDNYTNESLGVQLSVAVHEAEPIKKSKAVILVKVTVLFVCDSLQETIANIETLSFFGLDGVPEEFYDKKVDMLPSAIVTTLVSLAISTTRGAILAKGAGSFLEKMPLPIVDPKDFVPFT